VIVQMLTEKQDAIGLLFFLVILVIVIGLQFIIVKILDVYILGIGILFFIMGINFISVIIPVWMVYAQILVNIMSLKKMVSWP